MNGETKKERVFLTAKDMAKMAGEIVRRLTKEELTPGEIEIITACAHTLAVQSSIFYVLKEEKQTLT